MSIRITDSYLSSILVGDLNRSLSGLLEQQRMAGSMQRVNSYADDPRSVSSIQRLNSLITRNDSYLDNITRSRTLVDGTDIALQDLSEILADARVIALRESSSLANDQTMTNSEEELDSLVGRMMEILNSSIEGHYLFAGQSTDSTPFVRSEGGVVYTGDDGIVMGRTGPNSTMPLNIPGSLFMGSQAAVLGGSVDMRPALRDGTLLSEINGGDGWTSGSMTITSGSGDVYTVDLAGAVTLGDVIERINLGTKGTVTAAIRTDGQGLYLSGPGPLAAGEVKGGTTGASLGLSGMTAGTTLLGSDIRPDSGTDTLLSDIPTLRDSLPLATMEVTWDGGVTTVYLGSAQTLGDVMDIFSATLPGMDLVLQDGYLQAVGTGSTTFTIQDADSSASATALGLSGEGAPVRLFGVMEDLQAALIAGDKDAVSGTIGELLALNKTVGGLLIKNGGRQNDLDWAEGILLQRDERLRANLSLEKDVDVASVAADLSRAEASYQASLLVTSKLFANNLMQYLR